MAASALVYASPSPQSLADSVTAADPEWPKLAAVPGLTEPWGEVRDKWRLATEEFKVRSFRRQRNWMGECRRHGCPPWTSGWSIARRGTAMSVCMPTRQMQGSAAEHMPMSA